MLKMCEPYVNKLRDYWFKRQNAVIFDGQVNSCYIYSLNKHISLLKSSQQKEYLQDRLHKVIFFVLSLLDNARKPILILAASNTLSMWEAGFLKWSKLTNVVT